MRIKFAIAWPVAWALFWLGHVASMLAEALDSQSAIPSPMYCAAFSVYCTLMRWSLVVSGWGNAGVWFRPEAARKQNELVDAQIDSLRERTRRMQSGCALIEVDGSGLQPHLEAFMWEILCSIQLRVNED
jgi:hypothetical protein